jgi:hypothetical protein
MPCCPDGALVTGAASGIGAACADVLRRERVGRGRRPTPGPAGSVRARRDRRGGVGRSARRGGPVDGLVTSAGIRTRGMIVDTSLDDWERHLRVNVTGTWLAIRGSSGPDRRSGAGRRDRHDLVGERHDRRAGSGALRRLEGCHHGAHPGGRARGSAARSPGQRRRARPDPHPHGGRAARRPRPGPLADRPGTARPGRRTARGRRGRRVPAVGSCVVPQRARSSTSTAAGPPTQSEPPSHPRPAFHPTVWFFEIGTGWPH